jgi:hypothetical protein
VEAFGFRNGAHEAHGIARLYRQLIDDADLEPGGILVLLRSDPQGVYSGPLIEALQEVGIAAELPSNPFASLDEPTPRQLVCVLRLLRDREDGLAWRELLKLRPNGVGDGALMAVDRLADARGERYDRVLQTVAANPDALDHSMRTRVATDVGALNDLVDVLSEALDAAADVGLETVLDAMEFPGEERVTRSRSFFKASSLSKATIRPRCAISRRRFTARHFLFVTYARRRPRATEYLLQVSVARAYTTFLRDYLPPRQVE